MRTTRHVNLIWMGACAVLVVLAPLVAMAQDSAETLLEQAAARDAELNPVHYGNFPVEGPAAVPYPLFAGVDDLTTSAFLIDPLTDTSITAFTGATVYGSAYDPVNDKVYFNSGAVLYEWPVGAGTVTELGNITDATGASLVMVGLAYYEGYLYSTRNIANEAVYQIDPATRVATVYIDYVDADYDFGGVAIDPNTGEIYGTNDDSTPFGNGLFRINLDATATLIAPYPDAQTDIDGLAVSDDGFAYLVIDQPGSIYVWDFGAGAFTTPLTSPFTTSEVFSGGAWIYDAEGPHISLNKTVGTVPAVCAATDLIQVPYGTDVYYCYEVTNTGTVALEYHTLDDDQLGNLLSNVAVTLNPGDTYQHIEMANITAPVVNTGTWTATDVLPSYSYDDTVPFSFIDISATGTGLALSDDGEANVTMPFDFTFYGVTSNEVRIGNNGGLLFATTTGDIFAGNAALPATSVPLGILPFWDDLDTETGDVFYETQGVAPNRQFIVEWYMRPHYNGVGDATLELILYEGSNDILFQYADLDFGNASYNYGVSATVGLNMDSSVASQYSYNTASLTDNMAILWTQDPVAVASDSDTAEVQLADPDINVDPLSMLAAQLANTTTMQTLNIENVGDGPLDWTIDEDGGGVDSNFPPMRQAGAGDSAVAAETLQTPQEKDPPRLWSSNPPVWERPDVVLWDNGPLVTAVGTGAGGADESELDTTAGLNTLGFGHQLLNGNRVADDFEVTDPAGWFVETITFFAYQTGSTTTSTMTAVNLRIWDGSPDNPASTVVWGDTTTNILTSTAFSNIYRVTSTTSGASDRPIMANQVTVNTLLPQGTYWLDWQTDGTLASGPWAPPITILGTPVTGNGLQWTGAWAPALDTGTGTPQQGFPFVIEGGGTPPPCLAPSEIPWLSLSATSGSTLPAVTDMVDVTFDSTGLAIGLYEANLCVYSNDPDPGPGNGTDLVIVPVALEVLIPVELQQFTIE